MHIPGNMESHYGKPLWLELLTRPPTDYLIRDALNFSFEIVNSRHSSKYLHKNCTQIRSFASQHSFSYYPTDVSFGVVARRLELPEATAFVESVWPSMGVFTPVLSPIILVSSYDDASPEGCFIVFH